MKTFTAVVLGKTIKSLSLLLKKGGGSAAPGLLSLKVDPDLIEKLASQIPQNIIVTGTNGKTTTARLLTHFAKANNISVIRNATGSNLERGIASTLVSNYSILKGKLPNIQLGIWELDEAAFNSVAPKIKPQTIVFLNVFRDQMDRYGEIDNVVNKWAKTLKNMSKKTTVITNGDDANTSKLAEIFKGEVKTFGLKDTKIIGETTIGTPAKKSKLSLEADNIKTHGFSGTTFSLNYPSLKVKLLLPGIYHIYDFLAAFAVGLNLKFDTQKMINSLKTYTPAFGRMENLGFGHMMLIKNPTGATQVFSTLAPSLKHNDRLFIALNDNFADGTDVSWIWDAQFEILRKKVNKIFISGTRAYDLALRLKYAGISPTLFKIEPNIKKAFAKARFGLKGKLYILPTYTAMLELQKTLAQSGIKKNYWEEV